MDKAKTLYRTHHEQAKQASRHLSYIFWLGVIVSALSYILVARLLLYVIFSTDFLFPAIHLPFDPWLISVVLGVIPIIAMVNAYFDERRRMKKTDVGTLAMEMGAKPLKLNGNIEQQRLQNIVEEMSVASGIMPPPTLIMESDQSINAFVLGGAKRSVALTVSYGALQHLTRDELQALIAHEFGHIINEDVFIYSKLSAMLHGYYIVSEWRYGPQQAISSSRLSFLGGGSDDDKINIYHFVIGLWGFILLGCGRIIQASFSREREWMADAKSVEYTRNSAALVGVLKKALALQYLQAHTPKNRESVAHLFFINYQPVTNFLNKQTHPPIKERIKRYGGSACKDEIAALAHEMQENTRHSPLDDITKKHRQAFTSAVAYPILFIKKHASAKVHQISQEHKINAQMLICATFIFHSGRTFFELSQLKELDQLYLNQAKAYLPLIEKIHPIEQFFYYEHFCQQLTFNNDDNKRQFVQMVKKLITIDEDFTIYEWCYWLLLKQTMRPTPSDNTNYGTDKHYKQLEKELSNLFSFCVCVYSNVNEKRQQLFTYLIQNAVPVPINGFAQTALSNKTYLSIEKDIKALQQLKPIYKEQIIDGLQGALNTMKEQSLVSVYLYHTLKNLLTSTTTQQNKSKAQI